MSNSAVKKNLISVFLLLTIFLFTFFLVKKYHPPENSAGVYFLDVGQGDASLIKTLDGKNILIDGGPDSKVLFELGKILPWWNREIDLLILTHPHDDHVVGLLKVLDKYQVDKILYNGIPNGSPAYQAFLSAIKDRNINTKIISEPQKIRIDDKCILELIYPRFNISASENKNLNNTSIVSRLNCENKDFLFMGDAEKEVEAELLSSQDEISADVLKLGHHGSVTASSEEFLQAVNPQTAIISVGTDNSFGLPDLQIIRRLERLGITIKRTDQEGSLKYDF